MSLSPTGVRWVLAAGQYTAAQISMFRALAPPLCDAAIAVHNGGSVRGY